MTDLHDEQLSDVEVAESIARTAAAVLISIRGAHRDDDISALRNASDAGAQAHIAERLAALRPDDAVLSEEAKDTTERLSATRVWIIDPLDGTREYSESRDDWAVHVALWESDDLVAAAVALGGPERVLTTEGMSRSYEAAPRRMRIAVSRTRPPAIVAAIAGELDAELIPMGSAGVKICAVVTGEVDAYVHGGGQYEWDSAAPVAVARARGLHTSRLDGSPLVYNQPDPYLPDLVVCRPELKAQLLDAITRADS